MKMRKLSLVIRKAVNWVLMLGRIVGNDKTYIAAFGCRQLWTNVYLLFIHCLLNFYHLLGYVLCNNNGIYPYGSYALGRSSVLTEIVMVCVLLEGRTVGTQRRRSAVVRKGSIKKVTLEESPERVARLAKSRRSFWAEEMALPRNANVQSIMFRGEWGVC